jgi:hypothetical protein
MLHANGENYEGFYSEGLPSGVGTKKFENGEIYKGDFLLGYPHGKGTLFNEQGQVFHKGSFENGIPSE